MSKSNRFIDNLVNSCSFTGIMLAQKIPAKITPITVPIFELPQFVLVDTVIITEKYARDNNISVSATICKSLANKLQISKTDDAINTQPARSGISIANAAIVTHKKQADRPIITLPADNCFPTRSREQQTEPANKVDVAIQCERDTTDEWEAAFEQPSTTTDMYDEHDRKFRELVSNNTNMFPNGMLECRLCGEVASLLQEHHDHMAMVHFGAPALCTACGQMVRNELRMPQHNLICSARRQKMRRRRRLIKCPHLQCGVMLKSRRQLAKHIESHLGESLYCCLQCKKRFTTMALFLLHRLTESSCSKAKHIYLGKRWSRYSRKAAAKRCTVCRREFGSSADAAWHKRRCILVYQQRMLQLMMK